MSNYSKILTLIRKATTTVFYGGEYMTDELTTRLNQNLFDDNELTDAEWFKKHIKELSNGYLVNKNIIKIKQRGKNYGK